MSSASLGPHALALALAADRDTQKGTRTDGPHALLALRPRPQLGGSEHFCAVLRLRGLRF